MSKNPNEPQLHIKISQELWSKLRRAATDDHRSVSAYVRLQLEALMRDAAEPSK